MTIWANGTFDLLHVGHFNLLSYARHLAGYNGYFIVGIDSDERYEKIKGRNPLFNEKERLAALRSLQVTNAPLIDTIHIYNTDQELIDLIASVSPMYIVKGQEWRGREVIGQDLVKEVKFFVQPNTQAMIHSSEIIMRISNRYNKPL